MIVTMNDELFSDTVITRIISVDHTFRSKSYQGCNRPHHGIIYKLSGETIYRFEGNEYVFSAGKILYLPQGLPYSSLPSVPGESITVNFDCNLSKSMPNSLAIFDVFNIPIQSSFEELAHRWTFKKPAYSAKCFALLYTILANISKTTHNLGRLPKTKKLMTAIAYLEENFADSAMDINVLAKKADLSPSHFRRLFTNIYGMSPGKYLRSIRIAKAKDLLITENFTIGEIAEMTGYTNLYYFSKAFKKETGVPPSSYNT